MRKANLVRRLRATQFVAQASSPKGEFAQLYNKRAFKDCAKGELAPPNHGNYSAAPAEEFREYFYLHPPHVAQCPLHFFVCVPVAENIVPL